MGHKKGEYKFCDPHDHVNRVAVHERLLSHRHAHRHGPRQRASSSPSSTKLIDAFRAKAKEFANLLKMGRTQLQDAVPMTLGQEFKAFAKTLERRGPGAASASSGSCARSAWAAPPSARASTRPKGYAREVRGPPGEDHRLPDQAGRGSDRGDAGHAGLRALLVRPEEPRHQARQGRQRPAAPVVRPALRPARDQPAGHAARVVDHARAR